MVDVRVDEVREAWRRYVTLGQIEAALLRPEVRAAWERCHDLRVDPRRVHVEALSPVEAERLVARHADLLAASRPFLLALSRAAGRRPHAVLLADDRSRVLEAVGLGGAEAFPGRGALLDEALVGANGVGTTVATGAPVVLVGPEHFIEGFQGFTWLGQPVGGGEAPHAVLSISLRDAPATSALQRLLLVAARGIEAELIRVRLDAAIGAFRAADPSDARRLSALHEDLIQALASARVRFETAARAESLGRVEAAQAAAELAGGELARFTERARWWLELADVGETSWSVPVTPLLEALAQVQVMLGTELAVRRCALEVDALAAPRVRAPPWLVRRALFGGVLAALDRLPGGERLSARVREVGGQGEVGLQAGPSGQPVTLAWPLERDPR